MALEYFFHYSLHLQFSTFSFTIFLLSSQFSPPFFPCLFFLVRQQKFPGQKSLGGAPLAPRLLRHWFWIFYTLSGMHIVYEPVTETLHPTGDFWRPLFLETLAIGLLKTGCLQTSLCWIKPWGRFFQNGRQISTNVLFLVLFLFRQLSFSLMKYNHMGYTISQ